MHHQLYDSRDSIGFATELDAEIDEITRIVGPGFMSSKRELVDAYISMRTACKNMQTNVERITKDGYWISLASNNPFDSTHSLSQLAEWGEQVLERLGVFIVELDTEVYVCV